MVNADYVAVSQWMSDDPEFSYDRAEGPTLPGRRVPQAIFDRYAAACKEYDAALTAMHEAYRNAG